MRLYQADSFTSRMFRGNPAGVCIQTGELSDDMMQNIAMEMNLSETAFVRQEGLEHRLRWFTPEAEVDLCGHATLAAAHVLFREIGLKAMEIKFRTRSGLLVAKRSGDGIKLDFPAGEPKTAELPAEIMEGLGLAREEVEAVRFCAKRGKYLVHLKDPARITEISPNFSRMMEFQPDTFIGVIITARGKDHDFISRFFAPWVGVNEDPVTGSAHTVLAPYWSGILGKTRMNAYQASKRGGEITVELAGGRVFLTGNAVTVFRTEISPLS